MANIIDDSISHIQVGNELHPLDATFLNGKQDSDFQEKNLVTTVNFSSTDLQYPSAKAVNNKIVALTGDAIIASEENGVVILKAGVTESSGIISNSNSSDITLHRVATTGSPNDITVTYNEETVSLQTALANIKTDINSVSSTGTQYIISTSRDTTPNSTTYNGQTGTLSPSSTTAGRVYLVSNGNDTYVQWITTTSSNGNIYSWTSLGSTTVDLSGVVKIITLNGRQYAVSSGTTLIDLGYVVTSVKGQSTIVNGNTTYVHTVTTTTTDTTTGTDTVTLETQVKMGNVENNIAGLAEATDVKSNLDNKIIIRTWTSN